MFKDFLDSNKNHNPFSTFVNFVIFAIIGLVAAINLSNYIGPFYYGYYYSYNTVEAASTEEISKTRLILVKELSVKAPADLEFAFDITAKTTGFNTKPHLFVKKDKTVDSTEFRQFGENWVAPDIYNMKEIGLPKGWKAKSFSCDDGYSIAGVNEVSGIDVGREQTVTCTSKNVPDDGGGGGGGGGGIID